MKQQIIVSGIGGQGILFLTRIIAGAGVSVGLEIMTSETHGMAQRGGSVISFVKAGPFLSPLIRQGQGDIGLFLHADNLDVHQGLLRPGADLFVNTSNPGTYNNIAATELAREMGSAVLTNLIMLGFAAKHDSLFCGPKQLETAIREISRERFIDSNLAAFHRGLEG